MWGWRPEILFPLLLGGSACTIGWWRLSRRSPQPVPLRRLAVALGGLTSIAVALLSPVDTLAHALFWAHMVQHMLLMMVAAPLLLLADPLAVVLWALPRNARVRVGRLLAAGALPRRIWQALTWMPVAWVTYALTLWLWHLPSAYEAALRDRLLHDLEHLAFFWAGVLFWWPIINPAPHLWGRVPHALRVVYLVLGAFQQALLGLLLTLSPRVLYPSYLIAPRAGEWSPLEDQAWGGVVMWGLGGAIEMVGVLLLLFRLLSVQDAETSPSPSSP
ncbi:MAG: cytochrome c oxidase assembly protein [Candidatus Rokubacteria bacterium]|nr:cytochrome c oxidase assembly protein [Candidatus Rokubacteria bacterium]